MHTHSALGTENQAFITTPQSVAEKALRTLCTSSQPTLPPLLCKTLVNPVTMYYYYYVLLLLLLFKGFYYYTPLLKWP